MNARGMRILGPRVTARRMIAMQENEMLPTRTYAAPARIVWASTNGKESSVTDAEMLLAKRYGQVPAPMGVIKVRHEKTKDGKIESEISLPKACRRLKGVRKVSVGGD